MSDRRRKLLEATLRQVPFEGWTDRALRAGAAEAGVAPMTARRAFPGGVDDVLAYWAAESDRRMLDRLAKRDLDSMRVRDRITAAVRVRLELNAKHREAVRMALTRAALPGRAPGAMRALWRTVDAMWRAASDTATDYNFYTKRGLLAGVYVSTLLYWLDDKSEGFEETWAFLDRRVADVMRVPKVIGTLKKCVPDPARVLRVLRPRRAARG